MDRSPGERLRRRGLQLAHRVRTKRSRAPFDVQFSAGVTRFFPTVITGAPDDMLAALRNLARAKETLAEGAAMEGFHVEGPHISPDDGPRGAHPRRWVRPPDLDEFRRWQDAARGRIRLVTLSPEWPERPGYIEAIVAERRGGQHRPHKPSARQIADAVSAGATLSTHLGNGAHAVMRAPSELHLGATGRRPADGQISSWMAFTCRRRS